MIWRKHYEKESDCEVMYGGMPRTWHVYDTGKPDGGTGSGFGDGNGTGNGYVGNDG